MGIRIGLIVGCVCWVVATAAIAPGLSSQRVGELRRAKHHLDEAAQALTSLEERLAKWSQLQGISIPPRAPDAVLVSPEQRAAAEAEFGRVKSHLESASDLLAPLPVDHAEVKVEAKRRVDIAFRLVRCRTEMGNMLRPKSRPATGPDR